MFFRVRNKKGASTISIIRDFVLALVVLFVLIYIINLQTGGAFWSANRCEGTCMTSCGDFDYLGKGDIWCQKKNSNNPDMLCCAKAPDEEGDISGPGARSNQITISLNGAKTPLYYAQLEELDIGKTYYIDIFFDDELKKTLDELRKKADKEAKEEGEESTSSDTGNIYCGIWIEDDSGSSTEYALKNLQTKEVNYKIPVDVAPLMVPTDKIDIHPSGNEQGSVIRKCGMFNGKELLLFPRVFTPEEIDANRIYQLRVVVYNHEVSKEIGLSQTLTTAIRRELSFQDNWAAEFSAYFRVKPIIDITGISGIWVNEDDITITALQPYDLSKVEIGIVGVEKPKEEDKISLYQKIYDTCAGKNPSAPAPTYHDSIHRITSIVSGKAGVHVIGTIGRNAYATRAFMHQEYPIGVTENKAKIILDEASINSTFKIKSMLEESPTVDKLEEEYYLCVKALVSARGENPRTIYATTQQPLRLDVAPPYIRNDDDFMPIVYPKIKSFEENMNRLLNDGRVLPGQTVTAKYFEEYPAITIAKCFDKSGCKNYDYYFAPTQIPINIKSADLKTGVVATIVGYGLNYLYKELVESNPLKTVCPLPDSAQYRRNSHPEIRFYQHQQGVFCIKVVDAAGNYFLTWKVAYNPYDVLAEATEAVVTDALTPDDEKPIVPIIKT